MAKDAGHVQLLSYKSLYFLTRVQKIFFCDANKSGNKKESRKTCLTIQGHAEDWPSFYNRQSPNSEFFGKIRIWNIFTDERFLKFIGFIRKCRAHVKAHSHTIAFGYDQVLVIFYDERRAPSIGQPWNSWHFHTFPIFFPAAFFLSWFERLLTILRNDDFS